VKYFTEYDRLKAENEELRQLLEEERKKNDSADIALEENEWMKSFLIYAGGETKLSLIDAMAVSREAGDSISSFTLNKGSLSGISIGMAVIGDKGLVGYVSEVGLTYAKITTIINDNTYNEKTYLYTWSRREWSRCCRFSQSQRNGHLRKRHGIHQTTI
jgi:rod shape-determining protein MreC